MLLRALVTGPNLHVGAAAPRRAFDASPPPPPPPRPGRAGQPPVVRLRASEVSALLAERPELLDVMLMEMQDMEDADAAGE